VEVGAVSVRLNLDVSRLQAQLQGAKATITRFFSSAGFKEYQSQMRVASVAISAALGLAGRSAITAAGQIQDAQTAFAKFLGSAEEAEQFVTALQRFATKTPFDFSGLQDAAKRLLALGFSGESVLPILRRVGDAVAGMGGSSADVEGLVTVLGQVRAKGRATAEEMLQLTERGVNAWDYLAKRLGVTIPEAMEHVSKGAVDAGTALEAILEGVDQDFGGMMGEQAKNLNAQLANVKDNLWQVFGQVGLRIAEAIGPHLERIADWLGELAARIKAFGLREALEQMVPESVKIAIIGIAVALATALIPALISTIATMWPVILVVLALTAVAYVLVKTWDSAVKVLKAVWRTLRAEWGFVKASFVAGFAILKAGLATFLQYTVGMLVKFVGALADAFSFLEHVPGLGGLYASMRQGIHGLDNLITEFGESSRQGMVEAVANVKAAGAEVVDAAKDQFAAMKEFGRDAAGVVSDFFKEKDKPPLPEVGDDAKYASDQLGDLSGTANTAAGGMDALRESAEKAGSAVREAFSGFRAYALGEVNWRLGALAPDWQSLAAQQYASANRFAAGLPAAAYAAVPATSTLTVGGVVRVEGVNSRGDLVAVTRLLADDLRAEAERYPAAPSQRRWR